MKLFAQTYLPGWQVMAATAGRRQAPRRLMMMRRSGCGDGGELCCMFGRPSETFRGAGVGIV